MSDLAAALDALARANTLLVACDFDGALAPIVSVPSQAAPTPDAMAALRRLAALPATHVAVVSGRALADLAALVGDADRFRLVGSHGGEFDPPDAAHALTPERRALRDRVVARVRAVAAGAPGALAEAKPAGVAFHYRLTTPEAARLALDTLERDPAQWPGVHVRHGKKVIEFSVFETNKGHALRALRAAVGADACFYIGDDVTDEDAFAVLSGSDVGVKVGPGDTLARYRVDCPESVAPTLERLEQARKRWLADGRSSAHRGV